MFYFLLFLRTLTFTMPWSGCQFLIYSSETKHLPNFVTLNQKYLNLPFHRKTQMKSTFTKTSFVMWASHISRCVHCCLSSQHPVFPSNGWPLIFMFPFILIQLSFHMLFLIFIYIPCSCSVKRDTFPCSFLILSCIYSTCPSPCFLCSSGRDWPECYLSEISSLTQVLLWRQSNVTNHPDIYAESSI